MKTRTIAGLATLATSAALILAAATPAAHASVLGACGTAQVTPPPANTAAGLDESNNHIGVFPERTNFSLPSNMTVDITAPFSGVYNAPAQLTPGPIPAGTVVDSYYIHSDPVGAPLGLNAIKFSATLTFTNDIIGLITGGEATPPAPTEDVYLNASDHIVGLPGVSYALSSAPPRGLELNPFNDQVTVLGPRQIKVDFTATTGTDDMRVITRSSGAGAPVAGYRFVASDGGIFSFGNQPFFGSMGGRPLNQPMVGGVNTCSNDGYWTVARDGGIFTFGSAKFFGSTGNIKLNQPIVSMAATATQQGYWLFASDGGVFTFGDANFHGSLGNVKLNQPVVGAAADTSTKGYWMVARDGGIFSFGAPFFGSTGGIRLNQPIVGMAPTPDGLGYWLVASDGGVFTFGDAVFHGSTGAIRLNQPIVGMKVTPTGLGYWLIAADGGVFSFGDATFYGSTGAIKLTKPIVGAL